jgi:hypothetical protein
MIKVDYQTSKNIYKVCFEAVGNEKLLSVGYDLRGKYIGKGELKLGNEIKINENRLILHSDYGLPTPKGSDAGLMVAATTESTFLAMDIEGNLIKSSTWSGAGAAVILFLPVPILTHTEYTYLYKKTH